MSASGSATSAPAHTQLINIHVHGFAFDRSSPTIGRRHYRGDTNKVRATVSKVPDLSEKERGWAEDRAYIHIGYAPIVAEAERGPVNGNFFRVLWEAPIRDAGEDGEDFIPAGLNHHHQSWSCCEIKTISCIILKAASASSSSLARSTVASYDMGTVSAGGIAGGCVP